MGASLFGAAIAARPGYDWSHMTRAAFAASVLCLAYNVAFAAPAPQPTPAPCPGMAGLAVGQTRTFSFERMARLEPSKKTIARDTRVLHKPEGRPWTVDVTYGSDALDAKVVALHYLVDPPSGLYESLLERYGKGTPDPMEEGTSAWSVSQCGVHLRYRTAESNGHRVEELWITPLGVQPSPRPSPTPVAEAEEDLGESPAGAYFAQKRELYRSTAAELALGGGSNKEHEVRVRLVGIAAGQMDDLARLCTYLEAKQKRRFSPEFFGADLVALIEKREGRMLQSARYLEQTRLILRDALSLTTAIQSEIDLLYSKHATPQ